MSAVSEVRMRRHDRLGSRVGGPATSSTPRRLVLAALATALLCPVARAQPVDYPSRPVTIVTPFAAGSGPDAVLRLVSEKLQRHWNQRVLIDNRPGGGGFIAIEAVRRSPPDGYTLLQLDSEQVSALPHLYRARGFNTLDNFDPVAALFRTPFMVAVAVDSPWKSMRDLLAAARAEQGRMLYGSWGIGSPGHLGGVLLESTAGVSMQHVPYREVGQLYNSVGSGDLAWAFGSIPSSQGAFRSGKIRYLAVAAPRRIAQMPDVPTVAESGGPPEVDADVNSFVVLVAPKGVPVPVRERINAEVVRAVAEPDIRARFDTFAFEPIAWSPAEILRQAQQKSVIYERLVRRNNITLD